jgi:hypothetical protein
MAAIGNAVTYKRHPVTGFKGRYGLSISVVIKA